MNPTDLLTVARVSHAHALGVHPSILAALVPTAGLDPQSLPGGLRIRVIVTDAQGHTTPLTVEAWPGLPVSRIVALGAHEGYHARPTAPRATPRESAARPRTHRVS